MLDEENIRGSFRKSNSESDLINPAVIGNAYLDQVSGSIISEFYSANADRNDGHNVNVASDKVLRIEGYSPKLKCRFTVNVIDVITYPFPSYKAIKRSSCFHEKGHENPCGVSGTPYMLMFGILEILFFQIPDFTRFHGFPCWLLLCYSLIPLLVLALEFLKLLANIHRNGEKRSSGAVFSSIVPSQPKYQMIKGVFWLAPVMVSLCNVHLTHPPSIALSDVSYILSVTMTFASVTKICDSGCDVNFYVFNCSIYVWIWDLDTQNNWQRYLRSMALQHQTTNPTITIIHEETSTGDQSSINFKHTN
ncbi:phox-associated domain,Sorting nexin [Artemisia annua]|uniref:Phox-associated domain,Sorting nexin n=1 Tax=Artemisia annua TaxID=35608 RepID=A0A2U1M171_ARTAN|nr:phox-associated domain,Sorting nexin [Artemisia annua]